MNVGLQIYTKKRMYVIGRIHQQFARKIYAKLLKKVKV